MDHPKILFNHTFGSADAIFRGLLLNHAIPIVLSTKTSPLSAHRSSDHVYESKTDGSFEPRLEAGTASSDVNLICVRALEDCRIRTKLLLEYWMLSLL